MSSNPKVAVIDIGSNSIKLIVASHGVDAPLDIEHFSILETRIGEGITGTPPRLDDIAIRKGTDAVQKLVIEAKNYSPVSIEIVATSAVRDAINRDIFIESIKGVTGISLRVLSGEEEARFIGKGIQCDPRLSHLKNFTLLDLGGGSMECVRFRAGELVSANSLQLGSVRLSNLFQLDREKPLSPEKETEINTHVLKSLDEAGLTNSDSPSLEAILTGGACSVIQEYFDSTDLDSETILNYKAKVNQSTRLERIENLSIPSSRADIFPAAMTTIVATLNKLGCDKVHFSRYNLRYGIAQAALDTVSFRT
ncbi:hypothetical protein MLD52_06410 [Puniceicoccaceae bacterium K14]|nr:hypothetical protein [Puniceicoccaceae bacterium K14]